MLGFVKTDWHRVNLGGEIYKSRQKKRRIILALFAGLGFIVLNLVLYYLTSV